MGRHHRAPWDDTIGHYRLERNANQIFNRMEYVIVLATLYT